MRWFKFLIYFSLFAGALLNLGNAVIYLTGSGYDGKADLVWAFFDGLKGLDTFMGIACILIAIFQVFTRFKLSSFS